MYELVIIGGGPGGVAAGVYAARKKINTLLITESFGGQSIVSTDVQNWIGTKSVSGFDLAQMLEGHLRAQEGIEIVDGERVRAVKEIENGLEIETENGKSFKTKFLLVISGSHHRKLNIPGEKEFDGKGVVYCSTCDAPLFNGKTVAVVGGGNAGLEAVIDLFPYAPKIYLLEYTNTLKGDPVTQEKVKASDKVEIFMQAQALEVKGDGLVKSLSYKDLITGEVRELAIDGVFVEIGALPNSDFIKGLAELNGFGEIIVDHKTQKTSHPRIWAAGDVSDVLYKQNNISAGDAVKAVLDIYGHTTRQAE